MTWGGGGYQDIPNAQTWNGWATGREWEATGTGLDLWSDGPTFHLYYKTWTGSSWAASWTEDTAAKIEGFSTWRGVRDWWLGTKPGRAMITLDYTGGESSFTEQLVLRIQLTVDVPAGEQELWTGYIVSTNKTFNAAGYPVIQVQAVDNLAWSAQQAIPAQTGGTNTALGTILRTLLSTYGAGSLVAADYAGITTATGMGHTENIPAGNLIDAINIYMRGELGLLFIDAAGVYQFKVRGWWNPLGDPDATIGSLDRGSGGTRNDPSLTEAVYKFPYTVARFGAKVTYTSFTWNFHQSGGTLTNASTTAAIGTRQWTDTVYINQTNDSGGGGTSRGLDTLSTVIPNFPYYKGLFDDSAQLTINPLQTALALDYCALAEIGDFVEVAKETQEHIDGRWWVPGHIMGIGHTFNPNQGWVTQFDLDLGLAEADHDPFPE
jgi:hypothetical protein